MRIPKQVTICGKKFSVKELPKYGGGSFSEGKQELGVGTQFVDHVPEVFLHEVIESILSIRDMRYKLQNDSDDNGDYLFSFNHKEFQMFVKDVAAALKGVSFKEELCKPKKKHLRKK